MLCRKAHRLPSFHMYTMWVKWRNVGWSSTLVKPTTADCSYLLEKKKQRSENWKTHSHLDKQPSQSRVRKGRNERHQIYLHPSEFQLEVAPTVLQVTLRVSCGSDGRLSHLMACGTDVLPFEGCAGEFVGSVFQFLCPKLR